ncbi:hypothetical protein SLEP1_g3573 [Rubroshorea leprosula]|uniref:K-box domain-containing protein n=1 Tax=Rubroshorea leprosula TaxID=152421 RepID=A0AAV5HVF6_9ROSI|nr:hypothetical protein SLEP1_g3573 [Rubroshorea leprosula]
MLYTKEIPTCMPEMEQHMQLKGFLKFEILMSYWKLLGQRLGSCSFEELQEIGSQLEQSLKNVRARKVCNL